jgi:polyhydroxyalkanoate synthesis repressor PhaR
MTVQETDDEKKKPVTIKKYANRRLYNTATSSYVTLEHLSGMVKDGVDFVVYDAKIGEDITRSVLTHIIVEEEGKGQTMLPISFLRHLISFYGDSLQAVVPNYLEHTMHSFAHNQDQMRTYMDDAFGSLNPFGNLEEVSKKNMSMFENVMKMFTPFIPDVAPSRPASSASSNDMGSGSADIEALKNQLAAMQKQLDRISNDG